MACSREDAKYLAMAHVASLDLKGFRYEFIEISESKIHPDEWGAIFDVYSPQSSLMDGPIVLIVEKDTGKVRSYEARGDP